MAAINGFVLYSDGSVFMSLWDEFNITQPAAMPIGFSTLTEGALREQIERDIVLPIVRTANSNWIEGRTRLAALCSDDFWFAMMKAPEIRKTYENYAAAADLREETVWSRFMFAGVEWIHYRGTNDNTTIAVPPGECRFFPVGGEDIFKVYQAPGEDFRDANNEGREFYSYVVPDPRAPNYMGYVDIFLDTFPLYACIKPQVLLRGSAA